MSTVDKMKLAVTWFKQVASWLAHLQTVVIAIVPVAATIIYLWLFCWTEPHIRWMGLALQLAGVLSVAYGVAKTRKAFGHPSMVDRAMAFLRDRPRYPKPVEGNVALVLGGIGLMSSTGSATIGVAPEQTIEARLSVLEQQVKDIVTKAANDTAEIRGKLQEQRGMIKAESASRSEGDAKLHRQLEMTATGGLDLALCGALWLLVGTTLATVSAELARLL
jgi:hypothetical protein